MWGGKMCKLTDIQVLDKLHWQSGRTTRMMEEAIKYYASDKKVTIVCLNSSHKAILARAYPNMPYDCFITHIPKEITSDIFIDHEVAIREILKWERHWSRYNGN